MTTDVTSETIEPRKQWNNIFKCLEEHRISDPAKISFRNELK